VPQKWRCLCVTALLACPARGEEAFFVALLCTSVPLLSTAAILCLGITLAKVPSTEQAIPKDWTQLNPATDRRKEEEENEVHTTIRYRGPEERVRSEKGVQSIMVSGRAGDAGYALPSLASGSRKAG
jgi:hypothetical protein